MKLVSQITYKQQRICNDNYKLLSRGGSTKLAGSYLEEHFNVSVLHATLSYFIPLRKCLCTCFKIG